MTNDRHGRRQDRIRPGTVGSYSSIGRDRREEQNVPLKLVEIIGTGAMILAFFLMFVLFLAAV